MALSPAAAAALIKDSLRAYSARRLSFAFLQELEEKIIVPDGAAHTGIAEKSAEKNCCGSAEKEEKEYAAENILRDMLSCGSLGIPLIVIPPSLGGISCGLPGLAAAGFELGRADLGIATGVLATLLAAVPVFEGGTPFQKKRLSERMAGEKNGKFAGLVGAFAATEPHGGSSVSEINTSAERIIKNGHISAYRINGAKQWITNAGIADFYLVLAAAPGGPSWFLVNRGASGLSFGKSERKYGQNLSVTGSIFLDNVSVPAENLVGLKEGCGLAQAAAAFDITRFAVAAMSAGAGTAALENAVEYALSRKAGNTAFADNSAYMNSLIVPHFASMGAVCAYLYSVSAYGISSDGEMCLCGCRGKAAGADFSGLSAEAAIAKSFAADACVNACRAAAQACGGLGFSRDFAAGKRLADSLVLPVYEGASEVLRITVCRSRWQKMLKSGGRFYADRAELLMSCGGTDGGGSGCAAAAETLRILAGIMELCRRHKLTRDKYVSLKLGEIISAAEISAAFAMAASGLGRTDSAAAVPVFAGSISFDIETVKCLSRIFARETLAGTACKGLSLVEGTVSPSEELSAVDRQLLPGMDRIFALKRGSAADYAFAAGKIAEHIRRRRL